MSCIIAAILPSKFVAEEPQNKTYCIHHDVCTPSTLYETMHIGILILLQEACQQYFPISMKLTQDVSLLEKADEKKEQKCIQSDIRAMQSDMKDVKKGLIV